MNANTPLESGSQPPALSRSHVWLIPLAAIALIVIVVAVVIGVTHAPPPTSAQLAATQEARLLAQPYAPTGIGPCAKSSAPAATWQWSSGLVTCPSEGVTRLESGGYIAFDGFGQSGFPQNVTVHVTISFLPASPDSSPNTPIPGATPTPPGLSARSYAMLSTLSTAAPALSEAYTSGDQDPCLTVALNGEPAHEQDIVGVILCNNGAWANAAPPGTSARIGGVIQTPSGAPARYTITFNLTPSAITSTINNQPVELTPPGSITTHSLISDLTLSAIGANIGVNIQQFTLTRRS